MKKIKIFSVLFWVMIGLQISSPAQLIRPGISNNSETEIYREPIQRFLVKADNLFRKGNYLEALNQLDLAVQASPQNPETYLHRAMVRYRLGMRTEADQDIAFVSRLNPVATDLFGINGPKAQLDMLAFYPEDLYLELEWMDRMNSYELILFDWYNGKETYDKAGNKTQISQVAINHLSNILDAITQQDWILAEKEINLLGLKIENKSILLDLKGVVALGRGNKGQAANYFRTAIQEDSSNALAWANLSLTQRKNQSLNTALESINKAINLSPTLSTAYFDRAILHKDLGDLEAALKDYSSAIALEDIYPLPTLFNRALTFKKLGKLTSATHDLDYLIQLAPQEAMAYKVRGNIHLLSGKYDQAINDFTTAIRQDADLAEAYFNRGIAYLLNYKVSTACVDFKKSAAKGYERGTEKQVYYCNN